MVNGWGLYEEYSRGTYYLGKNNGVGHPGNVENTGSNTEWRAFDRSIYTAPESPPSAEPSGFIKSHTLFWFQQNFIQEHDSVSAFNVVHTVVGMQNLLDFGVHTGLYTVVGIDNLRYVCGLYPGANAGETGWVKWDPRTELWTSGVVTGTTRPSGNRMGPCVSHGGQLVHATNGVLTKYNPATDTIQQLAYTNGSSIDRPVISLGGLLVVSAGGGVITIHQELFGLSAVASLGPHAINIAGGGEFALMRFGGMVLTAIPSMATQRVDKFKFLVMFYTTTGGTGSRCYELEVLNPQIVPLITERTTMVPTAIPLQDPLIAPFPVAATENMAYPAGTSHPDYCYETAFDNVDFPPYLPSVAAPWGHCKVIRTTPPGNVIHVPLLFNGEGVALSEELLGSPPGGFTGNPGLNRSLAVSTSWIGGDDKRLNEGRPKWWPISVGLYSDPATEFGLLLTFWGQDIDPGGLSDVLILTSTDGQRPTTVATIKGGSPFAIDHGGCATIDFPEKRLINCTGSVLNNGDRNRVMNYTPQTAGKIPDVGSVLNIDPAGVEAGVVVFATGGSAIQRRVYLSVNGAISLLQNGDTVVQAGGANAGELYDLGEAFDAVQHRCIIDRGFNKAAIPDGTLFSFQPLGYASGSPTNPTGDNTTYSGYALEQVIGGGNVLADVIDSDGPVIGSLTETAAGGTDSDGPVISSLTETQAGAASSDGPVIAAVPDTLLTPQDLLRGRGAEPIEQGAGSIAWLADGVELSARNVANVTNNGKPGELLKLAPGPVPAFGVTLDGVVELGRATIDCVVGLAGSLSLVLDMAGAGLFAAGPMRAVVSLLAVSGLTTAPSLNLGANVGNDDQSPLTLLGLALLGDHEELPLLKPRPVLRSSDVLEIELAVQAVATTYVVEVVVYGFHRIP